MTFEKPEVEFVKIDMTDIILTSTCNGETSSSSGSGEDCIGCDAAMNNCSGFANHNPVSNS